VVYVISLSVSWAIWNNITAYILVSVHIHVEYVMNHSVNKVVWRDTSVFIVVSALIPVPYVICHTVSRVVWRNISAFILLSILKTVVHVWSHWVIRVVWRDISTFFPKDPYACSEFVLFIYTWCIFCVVILRCFGLFSWVATEHSNMDDLNARHQCYRNREKVPILMCKISSSPS